MKKRPPKRAAPKPAQPRVYFDLAPASRVPVRTLVRDENDAVGRLIVRLAAAFNDLKSAHFVLERLHALPFPLPTEGQTGERSGLMIHAIRLAGAVMFETLVVLRDETKALAHPEVAGARRRIAAASRTVWDELVALAKVPAPGRADAKPLLWYVRNKSASHYDRGLVSAFLRGFEELRAGEGAPAYSDGDSMERTRFYFADVALRAVVAAEAGVDVDVIERTVIDQTNRANFALKPMLVELIRGRVATDRERNAAR